MTDATYATVLDAVFAMDAYEHNPGDGSWLTDLAQFFSGRLVNGELGSYVVSDVSTAEEDSDNDFFAIGYYSPSSGQAIVSYRGTTDRLFEDFISGYTVAYAISPSGPDALDAVKFYQEVADLLGDPWQGASDITVVGHSLGGGLAGLVGAIYGLHGVLFDNMPFNSAAADAYADTLPTLNSTADPSDQILLPGGDGTEFYGPLSPYANSLNGLSAYQIAGQFLSPLTKFQTPAVQSLSAYAGIQNPFYQLHDIALLTMLLYAEVESKTGALNTAWQSIGTPLVDALFNDNLGAAIVPRTSAGTKFTASQMRTIIAYSALNSGYEPFGTTAIQSLFSDADILGGIETAGRFTGLLSDSVIYQPEHAPKAASPLAGLTEIAVQFAGDQAAAANTNAAIVGALSLVGSTLTAHLNPTQWTSTAGVYKTQPSKVAIVGLGDFVQGILSNLAGGKGSGAGWISSNAAQLSAPLITRLNEITEVDVALGGGNLSPTESLPTAFDNKPGGALLVGADGQGTITGSSGNDVIIAGKTVTTGNGNNLIITSKAAETINLGTGNNLIEEAGPGVNYTYNYASNAGTDLVIGSSQGGDSFTFDGADKAAFTVVWGGTGNDTVDINSSASSTTDVVLLNMSGVDGDNIADLDMSKLESYVDNNYENSSGGYGGYGGYGGSTQAPTIVILNPTSSDTLEYNGTVLSSPQVVSTSDNVPGAPNGIGGGASELLAASDPYGPYIIGTSEAGEVESPPGGGSWTVNQTLASTSNELSSNGIDFSYNGEGLGQLFVPDLDATSASGDLNLINFTSGEFGVSLNAGVGVTDGTQTESSTTYLVNSWSQETLESVASQLPGLDARFPGFAPLAAWLGTLIDSGQPLSLGQVTSSSTNTVTDGGDLVDPNALAMPTGPALNINDYLVAGSSGSESGSGSGSSSTVSASQFTANQSNFDSQNSGSLQVSDTAANISAIIDELSSDPNVSAITLTDSGTPTLALSASQVVNDTAALDKITNTTYAIDVDDTAADVSENLDALNVSSNVAAITLSDGSVSGLTLSIVQALGDTAALGKITNANYGISISDTAADVSAAFDALKADAGVDSITLVDSGTPTLDLSVSQALNDTSTLAEISNFTYGIEIEDTAANVLGNSAQLGADAQIAGITVVDSAANVVADATSLASNNQVTAIIVEDTAADVIADAATIAEDPKVTSTVVVDTAANILADGASLQGDTLIVADTAADVSANIEGLNGATTVHEIVLTDSGTPALALTVSQALDDTTALSEIANSNYSIDIADTAADVAAGLDVLASDTQVIAITLTDAGTPTLTLTAAQIVANAAVLAEITNPNLAIVLSDSAANVAANIDALNDESKITSIDLTDGGKPSLTLGAAQALDDTVALAKISGSNYSISLADTAADVSAAIDALNDDGKVSSITLTDSGTPVLDLSAAQALDDTTALGEITNSNYKIVVLDSTANILSDNAVFSANSHFASAVVVDSVANVLGQASVVAEDAQVSSVIVSDTAANVSANIDALNADVEIGAIALTDSGVPTLALSVAQALDDWRAIDGIVNENYGVAIYDTSANIAANIDVLNANELISSITLTDSGTPTLDLSAVQAAADVLVISKITNSNYKIVVSGSLSEIVPELATLNSNPNVSVDIVDTAANVSANLDALATATGLASISLTDYGVPTLSMTVSQVMGDATLTGKIAGSYAIAVTDTAANVLADQSALNGNPLVTSIAVDDTAASVLANSEALQDDTRITSLTIVDNVADILADGGSFASLAELTAVDVVDTAANVLASAAALSEVPQISSITVVDSAANIGANLVQIANDFQISAIRFTDTGTPVVTVAASAVSDAWKLDESGVSYAIHVVDSAANVAANIDQFYGWPVTSITLTDGGMPSLTLSVRQVLGDQSILSKISNAAYDVAVADSAADVAGNIDALSAIGNLSSITLTDGGSEVLKLSVAQALNDTAVLSKITNAGYAIEISDTSANILANAAALQVDPLISSVEVIDSATNVLENATALSADAQIAGVSVVDSVANVLADSAALILNPQVTSIQVADTAGNVSANLDALNGLSALSSIKLTDFGTLTLTVAQALDDRNALAAIASGPGFYQVAVSGSATDIANNLSALESDSNVTSVNVIDTLANFTANAAAFAGSTLVINFDPDPSPTVTLSSASEASNSAGQTITGTVTSNSSGTVAGQTVELTDNGTPLGSATVQADGSFTANVTLSNEGENAIVATVTDSNGNIGSSAAVVDTLDNIAPTVTITSAAEASNAAAQTIAGTVYANGAAVVAGQTVTLLDNGAELGTATVQTDGSFSAAVTLPNEGANSIVATVTDRYGNAASSAAVVDTLTANDLAVTISSEVLADDTGASSTDYVTSDGEVTLTGTTTAGTTVAIFDGAADVGAATISGTNWSFSTDLGSGTHQLDAVATDSSGATATSGTAPNIIVDDTSPAIDISAVSPFLEGSDIYLSIGGTSEAGDVIQIFQGATVLGTTTVNSAGAWTIDMPALTSGDSLSAVATDLAGSEGTASIETDEVNVAFYVSVQSGNSIAGSGTVDVPWSQDHISTLYVNAAASDVYLQANGYGDLTVGIFGDNDDFAVLADDLTASSGAVASGVSQLDFSDGTALDLNSPLTFTWLGDTSNFSLKGSDFGANIYDVTTGNGSITFGNSSQGGNGANTIDFDKGDDNLSVDLDGGTGTIVFGSDVSSQSVYWQANGYGDLVLQILGDETDSIDIHDDLTDGSGTVTSGISQLQFSDGSTVDLEQNPLTFTWFGNTNNYNLSGSDFGANLYDVTAADGSITFGNSSQGGNGQNTVEYGEGDGSLGVSLNGGTGDIEMGSGLTASDVYIQANGYGDLIVGIMGDALDSIIVHNDLTDSNGTVRSAVSEIQFGDGTAINLEQSPLTFTWLGNTNSYNLSGSDYGFNVFVITASNGSVNFGNTNDGGNGQNVIEYGEGDGSLNVSLNGGAGDIEMGSGLTASDVYIEANGYGDLIVGILGDASDSIIVHNDLTDSNGVATSILGQIQFSDGPAINLTQNPLTFTWLGNANGYNLTGSNYGSNVFDITTGNGSITFGNSNQGGNGENTIDFNEGDGSLSVSLNGGAGTIVFSTGVSSQNVYWQANGYGDLILQIRGDNTDSIAIHNDLTDSSGTVTSGISELQFSDGSTVSLEQNPLTFTWLGNESGYNLIGSTFGSNVYDITTGNGSITFANSAIAADDANIVQFGRGDGEAEISLNGSTGSIELASGIDPSDVLLTMSGSNLIVSIAGTEDSITVQNNFSTDDGTTSSAIGEISFADGTVWSSTTIIADAWIRGTSTDENITVPANGATVDAGPGNDTVNLSGNGADTIVFSTGDGNETINNPGSGYVRNDTLVLTDIDPSSAVLSRVGDYEMLLSVPATGDSIDIEDQFWTSGVQGVTSIEFADGTIWDNATLASDAWYRGTSTDETITLPSDGATVDAGPGNDTIDVSGNGGDTIVFSKGDGNETLNNPGSGYVRNDTLVLTDIDPTEVVLSRVGDYEMLLSVPSTGDSLSVLYQFDDGGSSVYGLSDIEFADGTIWDSATLASNAWYRGTSADETITLPSNGATVDAGPGNDTIDVSGNGADTIVFSKGDGNETLNNPSSGYVRNDTLVLTDIDPSEVVLSRVGDYEMLLSVPSTGDSMAVLYQFDNGSSSVYGLSSIEFADGTVWNSSTIDANAWVRGTSGNDSITAPTDGATIDPGPGNDYVNLTGTGADTVVFAKGDGQDTIDNTGSGYDRNDTLDLTDILPSEVQMTQSGDELIVSVPSTGDSIAALWQFDNSGSGIYGFNNIEFSDGTVWNRSNISDAVTTFTWAGSSTNTTLTGNDYGANIFQLGAGAETSNGGARNNAFEASASTGQATINLPSSTSSSNELDFTGGITDNQLWFTQSGNNLQIDLLGTSTQVTVDNWFAGGSQEMQEITAGSLKIDSQVSQLVQAMATYSASNPSFDPTSTSTMPTNSGVQNAMAAAWHS